MLICLTSSIGFLQRELESNIFAAEAATFFKNSLGYFWCLRATNRMAVKCNVIGGYRLSILGRFETLKNVNEHVKLTSGFINFM